MSNILFSSPRVGESVDEYYARIFLESSENARSESVVHAKRLDTLIVAESSSITGMVADRLLNREYDFERVVQEGARSLASGRVIVATLLAVAPELPSSPGNLWGFTRASAEYLFGKYFDPSNVSVRTFGNALSGRFLFEGKSASELTKRELSTVDPHFPVVIGVVATKK